MHRELAIPHFKYETVIRRFFCRIYPVVNSALVVYRVSNLRTTATPAFNSMLGGQGVAGGIWLVLIASEFV